MIHHHDGGAPFTRGFTAGEWACRTKVQSAPAQAERYEEACRSIYGDTGTKATSNSSPSAATDGSPYLNTAAAYTCFERRLEPFAPRARRETWVKRTAYLLMAV